MTKRAKLSEADRREIARRYAAGETADVLRTEFGCSRSYPTMLAAKYGKPKAHQRIRRRSWIR